MAARAAEYFARIKKKVRPQDPGQRPLRSFIDLYVTDLEAQNRSPSYVRDARHILLAFHAFVEEALEKEPVLADFMLDAARAFALYEQERNRSRYYFRGGVKEEDRRLSSVTVRKHLRQLKVFSSWLAREQWTRDDRGQPVSVLDRLELPKAEQRSSSP